MRLQGPRKNLLEGKEDIILGHELDWLALELFSRDFQDHEKKEAAGLERACDSNPRPTEHLESTDDWFLHITGLSLQAAENESVKKEYKSWRLTRLLSFRTRIAELTGHHILANGIEKMHTGKQSGPQKVLPRSSYHAWPDEYVFVKEAAKQLEAVLSDSIRILHGSTRSKNNKLQAGSIKLKLMISRHIWATTESTDTERDDYWASGIRDVAVAGEVGKRWRLNTAYIESILSLWLWSIKRASLGSNGYASNERTAEDIRRARFLAIEPCQPRAQAMAPEGQCEEDWNKQYEVPEETKPSTWIQTQLSNKPTDIKSGFLLYSLNDPSDETQDSLPELGDSLSLFVMRHSGYLNQSVWDIVGSLDNRLEDVRFFGWNVLRDLSKEDVGRFLGRSVRPDRVRTGPELGSWSYVSRAHPSTSRFRT